MREKAGPHRTGQGIGEKRIQDRRGQGGGEREREREREREGRERGERGQRRRGSLQAEWIGSVKK